MEWTGIERKWHEMVGRLQSGPATAQNLRAAPGDLVAAKAQGTAPAQDTVLDGRAMA